MAKLQISLRISESTKHKLDALAVRHGTQTEAVAVAVDRLYQIEVGPVCERCGSPSASPYWTDEGEKVWLCDGCADKNKQE